MNNFKKNIISIYGNKGKTWLSDLPEILSNVAKKYNLTKLSPINNLSFNYVVNAYQNDKPVIVKIGLDYKSLEHETSCLQTITRKVVPEIIAFDKNMIIMQRAVPGSTLREYFQKRDVEATKILCEVIKKIHSTVIPDSNSFRNVSALLGALDRHHKIPNEILSKARYLREKLLDSNYKEVLLHGDLHHDNILKNNDDWLVIDPKGYIGDAAFDLAAYLCNPIPYFIQADNPKYILKQRIRTCNEQLAIDERRIIDWLYVKTTLCWAWSLDDNVDSGYWLKFLQLIDAH